MKETLRKYLVQIIPMKIVASNYNPILLYHSVGNSKNFKETTIDHISLDVLKKHLLEAQKYWKFVSIDEYVRADDRKSLAAVTIDDGYKNVLDEALPLFEELNIPITIFINSSTLRGEIFWRDKVRYLIDNNLENDFIKASNIFTENNTLTFYQDTKKPVYNSKLIEKEIDVFLKKKNIDIEHSLNLCFDSNKYLIKHDLVYYGNHTDKHYLLSSLTKDEQFKEINTTKELLETLDVNVSNIFSIPFGGLGTYNEDTISILKDLKYNWILLSKGFLENINNSTEYIERVMIKNDDFQNSIKISFLRNIKSLVNF